MASSKRCAVVPALAASSTGVLPLDPVYEILLRLPAKELCRLRVVCRPWRVLLSDPQFIAAHAVRHPGPLFIARYASGQDTLVDIIDLSGQCVKKVLRTSKGDWVRDTFLDLVSVSKKTVGDRDQLLNPATGSAYEIPQELADEHVAAGLERSDYCIADYLFGKVAITGECKLMRMLLNFPDHNGDLFEICTLNSTSSSVPWSVMQAPPMHVLWGSDTRAVFDGIVYFLSEAAYWAFIHDGAIEGEWIVPFDLETEEWRASIRGPGNFVDGAVNMLNDYGDPSAKHLRLANLNGSLVTVHDKHPSMDLWFLVDIEKGLWVKQYSLQLEQYSRHLITDPLFILNDGRIVMFDGSGSLRLHDPRTNTFTNVLKLKRCCGISIYTGNLLGLLSHN